ncbi:MAG TPA: AMP-binding protein, partial [Mycobacteriales bacterium]|nr:AMP-binding protein [Mycobacteriales bacterium]
MSEVALDALLHETRRFEPPPALAAAANAQPGIYDEAARDRLAFWETQADWLTWTQRWQQVLEWEPPYAKWFIGGRLNASVNAVDRHVDAGFGDKVAYHWVGDAERESRSLTYADLQRAVCQAANALTELGVRAGDRVAIYMPMIPETVVTMLACARLGAPHNVVFCGFSAEALRGRILDSDARVVVTTDGQYRRGAATPVKPAVDEAISSCPDVRHVLVVRRTGDEVAWTDGRDVWWHDLVARQPDTHEAESFDAEQPLYIMYTSGTTAKPKGILHTTGGYLTQVASSHRYVFDLKPDSDVFWCAADIGWVTGHSYIVYGPLCNGATSLMYEGVPHPGDMDRWWKLIERFGVTILYTAPTTIRTLMKWGSELLAPYDLSSLRLLGSVGEPINPEAWMWYRTNVGGGRTPVVDT